MNEALQVAFQTGESAELGQTGDDTFDQLADLELVHFALPGIALQGAHGQANALLFAVDVDDFDFYFLSHFEHLGGVLDAVPGDFRKVYQTVCTVDIDERTEVSQAGDLAGI